MAEGSLVQLIKRIAREAEQAAQPANIIFGTVISLSPLTIQTDQKIILTEQFITIPEKLTDYEIEISFIDDLIIQGAYVRQEGTSTWGRQEMRFSPAVKHKVIIHNALKQGDVVILAQKAGGQHYIVLDRKAAAK